MYMITLNYKYEYDDYIAANNELYNLYQLKEFYKSRGIPPCNNTIFCIIFVFLITIVLLYDKSRRMVLFVSISFLLIYIISIILFLIAYAFLHLVKMLKNNLISAEDSKESETIKLLMDPYTINVYRGDREQSYDWANVSRIVNREDYIGIIFPKFQKPIIIPKRIFKSKAEQTKCWNYIQEHGNINITPKILICALIDCIFNKTK